MIRNILFYIFFVPATIVASLVCVLAKPWAVKSGQTWSRFVIWLTGLPVDLDLSVLDPNETYVFMVNHQSQLDIPLLAGILAPRPVSFVAKESLFKIPLFGPALKAVGHISIDRSNRRKAMASIDNAVNQAQNGRSILIFPEGTRGKDLEHIDEFKTGGMIIALKTGVPVVPIVVSGTGRALPKHKLLLRRATLKVRALPPIDPGRYTMKERETFKDDLHTMMNDAYQELRRD